MPDDFDEDVPTTDAEQAIYLINELALLMERARLSSWPREQADLFKRRLHEVSLEAGVTATWPEPRD